MIFEDYNDMSRLSLPQLNREFHQLRKEDPDNHAENFKAEMLNILMATVNYRNDLEIVDLTHRETDRIINRLRRACI